MIRLGLDIGTNSIGWWLYELKDGKPSKTIDGGVRIFSNGRDPQSGASRAVDRRTARAARRRRDRYLRRRASLVRKLADAGIMPADPDEQKALTLQDPYELRARALDHELTLPELGRALFHLNQRRGFKSNRKVDRGDNEAGKIALGTARLDQAMMSAGARTYGEFLHLRRASAPDDRRIPSVRTRLSLRKNDETGREVEAYDYFPSRAHLEDEFHRIWAAQTKYHPDALTDEVRDELFETIFFQRPLKEPQVGRCLFFDEPRLPRAHPLTQRRTLLETVNALRIRRRGREERSLTLDERNAILLKLDSKASKSPASANVSFDQLAKAIKLTPEECFSLESANRKGIACDAIRSMLAHKDRYGARWNAVSLERQIELVRRLRETANPEELFAWLKEEHGLESERAREVANSPLPEGYGRLGDTATRELIKRLEADVVTYDAAAQDAFGHHSDFRTGESFDRLPYYGQILERHVIPGSSDPSDPDIERYGRLTNPTVHIGLNQLRRLINRIIESHGCPDQIVVELARELKQSDTQKQEWNSEIRKNTEAAIARSKKLEELGVPDTGANRLILRLWEELNPSDPLNRCCPYTGKPISTVKLFDGSCDVDHILPFSRTIDDSIANRTLCFREANREKRNRTPWETWGGTERWPTIEANLKNLPRNKVWRFAPDAMEKFEGERDFIARQLTDTQHLSRLAREYLSCLFPERGTAPVWVTPGRLTEMLRRHWGLNSLLPDHDQRQTSKKKNRVDHRHHAIDAAVIGATDRGLLNVISREAGRRETRELEDVVANVPQPWDGFREDIGNQLDRIIVSHRADHGTIDFDARKRGLDSTTGRLHNDTAYGLTDEVSSTGVPMVVTRKPLASIKPDDLDKIRDHDLRLALQTATRGLSGKEFEAALADFSAKPGPYQGTRRVRLFVPTEVIRISDHSGRPYKGYKGDSNHYFEVWEMPNGRWVREVYTTFEAHQPNLQKKPHPAARRIMRLQKKDMIALDHPTHGPMIATIAKLSLQRLDLVPHTEGDADRRARDKSDPFDFVRVSVSTLQKAGARRVHVDEIGRLRDPGPHHLRRQPSS